MARFVRIKSPENDPVETIFDAEQVVRIDVDNPKLVESGVKLTLSRGPMVSLTHQEWQRVKPVIAPEEKISDA